MSGNGVRGAGGRASRYREMKKCVSDHGDDLTDVFMSNFSDCYTLNVQLIVY